MRTEQIMLDPVGALLHLERWCNDGSPSGLSFGEHQVSPSYRPRGDTASFPAPSRTVPWAGAEVSMAAPSSALVREIVRPDGVVLVMHPDNPLSRAGTAQVPRMVAPTASARTVAVLDSGSPYYAKLHYPGLLGRVPREMDAKRVRASVRMSAALDQETALLPDVCAYLPESIGIVTRLGHTEQGVVYREFVPRSRLGGDTGKSIPPQVPLFSLFSTDIRSPDDPPLLVDLLRTAGGGTRADEAFTSLLDLLLESYAALAFGVGLVPEDHAQNVLLELDPSGIPRRVVRRDLLDWYADLEIRRLRTLPTDFARVLDTEHDAARAYGGRSYAFDFRLGEYVLDPLIACAAQHMGVDAERTRAWVKGRVHALAAAHDLDLHDYFRPFDHTSRYERGLRIWSDGRPLFQAGPAPVYR
ncbi:ferric iron reductase [Streptomyces anulatus]|uniref:ferric iron reductase n=1 Tax=Streptomyces anulatus TaxID=1892 RepID=UPI002251DE5D|nr:ferric iron reductase [Streptomyces anulatus]MCX4604799.1 ferric iron reductase [Streptomyces anulatus]